MGDFTSRLEIRRPGPIEVQQVDALLDALAAEHREARNRGRIPRGTSSNKMFLCRDASISAFLRAVPSSFAHGEIGR